MGGTRKTMVYIACSVDGMITGKDEAMDFLSLVEKEGEDYGYNAFIREVDTIIMGKRTYDWVMTQVAEFPHHDTETYIITHQELPAQGKLSFYNGDLISLVTRLKQKEGKTIFIDGGAQVIHQLLEEKLIDELIISIIPILLGNGLALFKQNRPLQNLALINQQKYDSGLVQLHYVCT